MGASRALTVEIPREGGKITEGVIGSPRFINPLLAISDTDRDLTSLVYSGLMKATAEGALVNNLAESVEILDGGLRYIFIIKEDAVFHDGESVDADDIVFTVEMAKNDLLKSPRRASWEGIDVEKIDNKTVMFSLNEPYSPFLENATIGILPFHIWGELKVEEITFSDFNIEPIGSGPYEVKDIKKNSSGIPESYKLSAFGEHILGEPFIQEIELKFYDSEGGLIRAFNKRNVNNIHSISPESTASLKGRGTTIITSPLPRVFGLFFNQNQATVFTNIEARAALNAGINKERIISEVLNEFGTSVDEPLPPGISIRRKVKITEDSNLNPTEEAINILERNGWARGSDNIMIKKTKKEDYRLSFSISTSNAPELKSVANILKEEWEKIGAEIELRFFETGLLNQEVIRPREYDSLLFGEIVGRDFDLFAFWHSSQRNDPGLNIALYTNITADSLLEGIRTTSTRREKEDLYIEFEREIENDIPAVFLYSPDFIYATNKKIKGLSVGIVTTPAERFLHVDEWYLKTDRVWPFFTN
jgi:peptide/nickel transport system substrate-binding protein